MSEQDTQETTKRITIGTMRRLAYRNAELIREAARWLDSYLPKSPHEFRELGLPRLRNLATWIEMDADELAALRTAAPPYMTHCGAAKCAEVVAATARLLSLLTAATRQRPAAGADRPEGG